MSPSARNEESLWPTLQINMLKTRPEDSSWTISASTAICAGKPHRQILHAVITVAIPMSLNNLQRRRKKLFARKQWKDARSKRSETTAKAERDRTRTMNHPTKSMQRMVKPEALAGASAPECFRRLKWNEVVLSGDFISDKRLGLQPWEGPGGFRDGSFARPIYRREETERFRTPSTKKQQ